MNKTKISNLLACYHELASGESLEFLYSKYVKADVIIAQELFAKGVTLKELEDFIAKRDSHLASMKSEKL